MVTAVAVASVVIVAVVGALVASGAVAALVPVPWVFMAAGMLAFLGLDLTGAAWVAAHRTRAEHRHRARWLLFAGTAIPLLAVFIVTTLIPPADIGPPPQNALPGGEHVALSTGSRLAVWRLPARGPARRPPIVILHGGPGVPDLATNARALAPLTGLGSDVYLYAQLGGGTSTRLADPRGYGRDRDVADLEALRLRLGLDRMVLLGHSYGGALAAAYTAAHPEHVARLVLVSPGPLDPADTSPTRATTDLELGHKLRQYAQVLAPRPLLGYLLLQVNPAAAHAFFGDREADARNDAVLNLAEPALFCHGAPAGLPPVRGSGFYAMQYPQSATAPPATDPRPALTGLPVPTLIVKGSCDYLSWHSALDYRDRLPHSRLIYFAGAGHNAHQEKPREFLAAVSAVLQNRPPAQPPILGDQPPPDYQGPP